MDERIEARARELWDAVRQKMGGGLPWERLGDHVRDIYRGDARRELEAKP